MPLRSTSKKTLLVVTLLLSSTLILGAKTLLTRAEPDTLYVPDNYEKIQWAIGNATAADSIFIRSGIYREHLKVNKPLTLIGESKETTVIDGDEENQTIIDVTASNVVITGITVRNSSRTAGTSYAGIKVSGHNCNITGNLVTQTKMGIFVTSQNSRIVGNAVTKNGQGIALYSSTGVRVEENTAAANTVGISLALSTNNVVIHNKVMNSSIGGHGITLSSSSLDNTILENELVGNYHGMWLSGSSDNSIMNNTIANNKLLGIELASSSNNTFYHNNFINNGIQPYAPSIKHITIDNMSVSTWDNGYFSGGNYWHGYAGIDEKTGPNQDQPGSDQIWDNPYVINANNCDNYPSTIPYSNITSLLPSVESQGGQDDQPMQIDTSPIWMSALAGLLGVVMLIVVFWKRSAKSRKRKPRAMIRK
jgi:parallel beta-helix repeat protein